MSPLSLLDRIKDSELRTLLGEVQQFAEMVWGGQRLLPGFTDHGPNHSRRVALRIEEFLQGSYLSEDEAFVLLAACWLHDVCMQDYGLLEEENPCRYLGSAPSVDELHLVRKRHAVRIRDLMLRDDRTVVLRGAGAKDGLVREPCQFPRLGPHTRYIANVAYGHSTAGFPEVERLPTDLGPTGRDKFRCGLLAALLLLGDECDLDQSRANSIDNAGVERLHPVSALHQLRHRYVIRSQLAVSPDDPNARQLVLVYGWPDSDPGVPPKYGHWIEAKILAQMNLVQPTLARALGIRFDWLRPFQIEEPLVHLDVEGLPDNVVPFLDAERARMDLADLQDLLQEIKQGLDEVSVFVLVEPHYANALGARELAILSIAELVLSSLEPDLHPYRQVLIDPMDDPTCTDPATLYSRIVASSDEAQSRGTWEVDPLHIGIKDMQEQIRRSGPLIVFVASAQELPALSRKLLVDCLIPIACQLPSMKVFVTTDAAEDLFPRTPSDTSIRLLTVPTVDGDDVLEMLRCHTLCDRDQLLRELGDVDAFTQPDALRIAELYAPLR